jgi:hypothetical protein
MMRHRTSGPLTERFVRRFVAERARRGAPPIMMDNLSNLMSLPPQKMMDLIERAVSAGRLECGRSGNGRPTTIRVGSAPALPLVVPAAGGQPNPPPRSHGASSPLSHAIGPSSSNTAGGNTSGGYTLAEAMTRIRQVVVPAALKRRREGRGHITVNDLMSLLHVKGSDSDRGIVLNAATRCGEFELGGHPDLGRERPLILVSSRHASPARGAGSRRERSR